MGIFNWGKAVKDAGDGVNSAFTGVGSGISDIIDSAKGQNPDLDLLKVQIAGELKKAEIQANIKVQEILAEGQKATYQFALQYEGTAEQVPKWLLVFRSMIRPVTTALMVGSIIFFMGEDILAGEIYYMTALPDQYWWMLGMVLGFWFGGKAIENSIDKVNKKV